MSRNDVKIIMFFSKRIILSFGSFYFISILLKEIIDVQQTNKDMVTSIESGIFCEKFLVILAAPMKTFFNSFFCHFQCKHLALTNPLYYKR